ncbi:MAG TPA: hypothetical protein VGB62_03515 [Allosphingosinicella sp.]
MRLWIAGVTLTLGLPAAALADITVRPGTRSHVLQASGPRIVVYEGAPPQGTSNGANDTRLGVRIYERPFGDPFAAVAAQELYEITFKRAAGPAAAQRRRREMELTSHAVESLVAARFYGRDLAAYERVEATGMVRYPHLRGLSQDEIVAGMRGKRAQAERWVRDNDALIRRLVAYRFPG